MSTELTNKINISASSGKIEFREFFTKHERDIDWNESDPSGRTPLQAAIEYEQWEVIKFLLNAGATPRSDFEQVNINYLELINEKHLYKYCPADIAKFPIETMLANTYSNIMEANYLHPILTRLYNNEKLAKLIFTASLDCKDHKIILVDSLRKYNAQILEHSIINGLESDTILGFYRPFEKEVTVQALPDGKFDEEMFIHEFAHKLMFQLFNQSEPYSDDVEKREYHSSITKTLNNILSYFEYWFQTNAARSLLEIKPNHHSLTNFELGQFLLDSLEYAANVIEQKFMSALSQANSTYNKDYDLEAAKSDKCYFDKCYFKSITIFLSVYQYDPSQEDAEFIVRYPEVIAERCYDSHLGTQAILEPIKSYWDKVVEKKMDEYIAKAVDVNTLVCPADTTPFGLEAF